MIHKLSLFLCAFLLAGPLPAQQARYDDVIRNLRNPDPKIRLSAVRLLRVSKYPEAIGPMAALITDPVDEIQLEAIAAELSFFLVDDLPLKKRVGLVLEVRNAAVAPVAFERGPLAVWPREAPPELPTALLQAIDDESQRVRLEAIYALGTIATPPLDEQQSARLVKALDHYDPAIRAGAARVAGRLQVKSAADALLKGIDDSNGAVRYAAMRALGAMREERAAQTLTDQFIYYGK